MGDMERGPVLVAEDEPSIRELLIEALREAGITAIPACDGEEAVKFALEKRPAAVILDIGLPFIDGAEVAARIRDRYGDTVPFVVVTAGARIDETSRSVRAVSYVAKPFEVDDLVRAVRLALEPPPGALSEGTAPSVA